MHSLLLQQALNPSPASAPRSSLCHLSRLYSSLLMAHSLPANPPVSWRMFGCVPLCVAQCLPRNAPSLHSAMPCHAAVAACPPQCRGLQKCLPLDETTGALSFHLVSTDRAGAILFEPLLYASCLAAIPHGMLSSTSTPACLTHTLVSHTREWPQASRGRHRPEWKKCLHGSVMTRSLLPYSNWHTSHFSLPTWSRLTAISRTAAFAQGMHMAACGDHVLVVSAAQTPRHSADGAASDLSTLSAS